MLSKSRMKLGERERERERMFPFLDLSLFILLVKVYLLLTNLREAQKCAYMLPLPGITFEQFFFRRFCQHPQQHFYCENLGTKFGFLWR